MFLLIFLIISIAMIIIFIIAIRSDSTSSNTNSSVDHQRIDEMNIQPNIGAVVSDNLYEEIQDYCRKNSLTVSDLIHKSIRYYIDSNP